MLWRVVWFGVSCDMLWCVASWRGVCRVAWSLVWFLIVVWCVGVSCDEV